jgi:hypothetical protein
MPSLRARLDRLERSREDWISRDEALEIATNLDGVFAREAPALPQGTVTVGLDTLTWERGMCPLDAWTRYLLKCADLLRDELKGEDETRERLRLGFRALVAEEQR